MTEILSLEQLDVSYWLGSNLIAVVACAEWVAIVREPGGRSDDELRALLNAPAVSTVQRIRRAEPDGPLLGVGETFSCMVCGQERFDAQISVAHRPTGLALGGPWNVRYCNDRQRCVQVATAPGVWPPEHSDWCIPALKVHAIPHRGCILR